MYYGGRPERAAPWKTVALATAGAIGGAACGFIAYLLATVFPHMLHSALPAMTGAWFLGLWMGAVAVAVLAFAHVVRHGRGSDTKTFAATGIAVVALLFALDATGIRTIFPWDRVFYMAIGIERPPPERHAIR